MGRSRIADECIACLKPIPFRNKMIDILAKFPEVKQTLSQVGRTNDGTDPKGFYNVQIQVDLKPKEEWKRRITEEQLD